MWGPKSPILDFCLEPCMFQCVCRAMTGLAEEFPSSTSSLERTPVLPPLLPPLLYGPLMHFTLCMHVWTFRLVFLLHMPKKHRKSGMRIFPTLTREPEVPAL